MMRLFAAISLSEDARDRLAALSLMLPLPRRVPPENMHLTLAFLGEIPDPVAEDIHHAFEAIRAPRFTLTLRGAGVFGGDKPRAVYAGTLPEPALDRLQAKVDTAARRAGARIDTKRFVPHVTVGRFKPGEADITRLEHALVDCAGFATEPFEVDHFALMRSHLGQRAPHYDELARYPLL